MLRIHARAMKRGEDRPCLATLSQAKVAGVLLVLVIMKALAGDFASPALADDAAGPPPLTSIQSTLCGPSIAAFSWFFMQARLHDARGGFARTRETVTSSSRHRRYLPLRRALLGHGPLRSVRCRQRVLGHPYFVLQGGSPTPTVDARRLPSLLALPVRSRRYLQHDHLGRHGWPYRFGGTLLYSFGVSEFIYPIIGHWAWGPDGWLNTSTGSRFHNFAGSTVVHTDRRLHRPDRCDRPRPRPRRRFQAGRRRMPPWSRHGHRVVVASFSGSAGTGSPGKHALRAWKMIGCGRSRRTPPSRLAPAASGAHLHLSRNRCGTAA